MLISEAMLFSCLFFSLKAPCMLFTRCTSISPERFTMVFFSSLYIFSFSFSLSSFSTTSSVFAISLFCRFWIFLSNS